MKQCHCNTLQDFRQALWPPTHVIKALRQAGFFVDPMEEWTALATAVTDLYRLSGTWSEPYRSMVLNELKAFFSEAPTDWDCLRDHDKKWVSNENFQQYFGAWWTLREAARLKSEALARRLLE